MKNAIINYLLVPFRTLALIIKFIADSRHWIKEQLAHPRMQAAFKVAIAITVIGWFVIWLFRDKYRDHLSEMIQGLY